MNKRFNENKSNIRKSKVGSVFAVIGLCSLIVVMLFCMTSSGIDENSVAQNTLTHARIGLKYASSAVSSFTFTVENGIEYGIQNKDTHEFYSLGSDNGGYFTVIPDAGSYYVKISHYKRGDSLVADHKGVSEMVATLDKSGAEIFVYYNNDGSGEVRIGEFNSEDSAKQCLDKINSAVETLNNSTNADGKLTFKMSVLKSNDSSFVIKNGEGEIITGYAQNEPTYTMGIKALPNADGVEPYIVSDGCLYKGTLEFRKLVKGSTISKMNVINVLDIETYVAACMSYEISYSWPIEAQKTFSIVVRTYLYGQLHRHQSYDFNLCGTTHCQVYNGFDRMDDSLIQSAKATEGLVVVDGGKNLAKIYYYSADGGSTASCKDVWGSEYSYLSAVPTPWETYRVYGENGRTKWREEFSPWQLYQQVKGSCPELKGSITSVTTELAEDSSHVYSITFTDIYGNTSTVKGAEKVRGMLGVKSSNFVVGKSGDVVERTVYSLDCYDSVYSDKQDAYEVVGGSFSAVTSNGDVGLTGGFNMVTSTKDTYISNFKDYRVQIVTANNGWAWVTEDGLPDILKAKVETEKVKVTLIGESGNFVFDGCGWGHGVGLSQHGIKNLVAAGYGCETILKYYLSGTEIVGVNMLDQ